MGEGAFRSGLWGAFEPGFLMIGWAGVRSSKDADDLLGLGAFEPGFLLIGWAWVHSSRASDCCLDLGAFESGV